MGARRSRGPHAWVDIDGAAALRACDRAADRVRPYTDRAAQRRSALICSPAIAAPAGLPHWTGRVSRQGRCRPRNQPPRTASGWRARCWRGRTRRRRCVCATDRLAVGALHAIASLGLRAGRDVSVIGYDDLPLATYTTPALTTFAQPIEQAAERMVAMLVQLMAGAAPAGLREVLQARLIARDSDGPAPTERRGRRPADPPHQKRRENSTMSRISRLSARTRCYHSRRPGRRAAEGLVFLSTQLRPVEEAQKVRDVILLKGAPAPVDFVPEMPPQLTVRIKAEQQGSAHTISLIGALHGELQPLRDDGRADAAGRPGRQARRPRLPRQACCKLAHLRHRAPDVHPLDAGDLHHGRQQAGAAVSCRPAPTSTRSPTTSWRQWAQAIQAKTGRRMLGFPAGPQGPDGTILRGLPVSVLHRRRRHPVQAPRRPKRCGPQFAALWKTVTPNSTNYNFMQEPLLSGEVWIAWDHIARMQDALRAEAGRFRRLPRSRRAEGPRLHAGDRRPRDHQGRAGQGGRGGG